MNKQQVLFIYDYFFPAFRAGGITQSTYNLFDALKGKFEINVICLNNDFNGEPFDESKKLESAYYINKFLILFYLFKSSKKNLDIVYLNGVFSLFFFLIPLIYFKIFYSKIRVVIAPRGMIQSGALEIRRFKKLFYLKIIKSLGLFNKVIWHATDEQEKIDIRKFFGDKVVVHVAANIPKQPHSSFLPAKKESDNLKLIFLSLITEKKNLYLLLLSLKELNVNIQLDIYGPIKDQLYWQNCLNLISKMPSNIKINYMGVIEPVKVQGVIQNYHAFILPSKGENFGHAIYESLSVGRPVIISEFTPWKKLNEKKAGWNTQLNVKSITMAILELNSIDSQTYRLYCENSFHLAEQYYRESIQIETYEKIFG